MSEGHQRQMMLCADDPSHMLKESGPKCSTGNISNYRKELYFGDYFQPSEFYSRSLTTNRKLSVYRNKITPIVKFQPR